MSVLLIHSHFGPPPACFNIAAEAGLVTILRESALDAGMLASATGIITTTHLDQVWFSRHRAEIATMLGRGGRLFFNGHILRPFAEGLEVYRPMLSKQLADFRLVQVNPHPVFGDLDPADMMTRKGVAGFYGRGHNPLPRRARMITGLGPLKLPVDWEWALPDGGVIFSHAGNDLWGQAPDGAAGASDFAMRIARWTAGESVEVAA